MSMLIANQPNSTLYIKNIDWKVKKGLLRRSLYSLFTRHGKVLEIIALRKDGLRGQAFVIMDTIQSATAAMHAEQGFTFFGKDIAIEYAKETSNRIARRDGTYLPKSKRRKVEPVPTSQPQVGNDETTNVQQLISASTNSAAAVAFKTETVADATPNSATGAMTDVFKDNNDVKEVNLDGSDDTITVPSNVLLAQNLPAECSEVVLGMLFQQYSGYREVRVPRPGIAFIEFVDEPHATIARRAMNGFKLTSTANLHLIYAKNP